MNNNPEEQVDQHAGNSTGEFLQLLVEINERNNPNNQDGEALRTELQAQLSEVRDIVAEYSEGGQITDSGTIERIRAVRDSIAQARTYEIRNVNMAHAWPAEINRQMQQHRVMDIELRDPDTASIEAALQITKNYEGRCRLIMVLAGDKDKNTLIATVREQIPGAQEGRDFSFVVMTQLHDVAFAGIADYVDRSPENLYVDDEGAIWYRSLDLDNPLTQLEINDEAVTVLPGIKLLDADGQPTSTALEAATFINAVNADTVHLITSHISAQTERDRIWELVRAMSTRAVDYHMYHEVFYDDDTDSAGALKGTAQALGGVEDQDDQLDAKEFFDFGFDWEVVEYVTRNYGEKILPEDKAIMDFVSGELRKQRESGQLELGSLDSAADIGAGPNLYTMMMVLPYLSGNARLRLADFAPANRRYLEWFAAGEPLDTPEGQEFGSLKDVYRKFEDYLAEQDTVYVGAYDKLRNLLESSQDSVEFINLYAPGDSAEPVDIVASSAERQRLDMVTSAFVTESMASSYSEFVLLTRNVLAQARPGGRFVLMHMSESEGYNAGDDNNFPASKVSLEMVKEVYIKLVGEGNFSITLAEDEHEKAREGYEGMIVVTGKLPKVLPNLTEVLDIKGKLS